MSNSGARQRSLAIAPYVALLLVVVGIGWYAVQAHGDDSQQPHLHDNGVWVVNDNLRFFGRLDKAIGQLDAAYYAANGNRGLDIVQEDSAVVGVDHTTNTVSAIDPATVDVPDGGSTKVAADAQVELRGGTLALVAPATGGVWATRVDPSAGAPDVAGLSGQQKPLSTVGNDAALAVSDSGTVFAYSADTGTLATMRVDGQSLSAPDTRPLDPSAAGTTLTAVGETPVLLAPDGELRVVGGPTVHVPAGSVLQQPGPSSDAVLVGEPDGLVRIDLGNGTVAKVGGGGGTPVAPVHLGPCVYGAWAGSTTASVLTQCGHTDASVQQVALSPGAQLVFRVNRGQIVLNDTASGQVWNVDSKLLTSPDDWESFQNQDDNQGKSDVENPDQGKRQAVTAAPDKVGARPGVDTIIHPLDNDSGPTGRVLAITHVDQASNATVAISPDGQLLQVRLNGSSPTTFKYTINDGVAGDRSSTASVRVDPRNANGPPAVRPKYTDPVVYVAAGGTVDIPIVRDWRDPDGDPLTLGSASTGSDDLGTARPLEDGDIRFTAPSHEAAVRIHYTVTDGHASSPRDLTVHVQAPSDLDSHAPVAEPDVVSGEVGSPIEIHPLDNDLAGSDPADSSARLKLGSDVVGPADVKLDTDQDTGVVTAVADAAGSYLLSYDAGFGDATPAPGVIRVDVRPASGDQPPLTMPDAATVHDTDPTLVDVLANDVDPGGGVLTVQSATPQDPQKVTATVVDGHWVRVASTGAAVPGQAQTVSYTVSNGTQDVTGQIVVTPTAAPEDGSPVTAVDRVTVRAGAAVTVPVLDNDVSPRGDPLHLADDVIPSQPGSLEVSGADGDKDPADVGRAFVSGSLVRYLAPDRSDNTFTVNYVAANSHGETAPGQLVVTVADNRAQNHDPTPPEMVGRVSAGGTIRLPLVGSGADPDGDPVSITGLAMAPELGRVVEVRGDSILYQAYPGSLGTDEFQYLVSDDRGGVGTGTVRVGISPPHVPLPPQAVPDEVTAAPGRTVAVDVTANDQIEPGDQARVSVPKGQPGVSAPSGGSLVDVAVPANAPPGDITAVYDLGDGAGSTTSTLTVHVSRGYDNPPVVDDVFAAEGKGDRVTVDLLENAYDPDGATHGDGDLRVTAVDAPASVATRSGPKLTVERGVRPRVVPFVVADADGGTASGTVYVPARTGARPEVKPDALITMDAGATTSQRLSSYAVNTGGGPVRFTLSNRVWSSPADVQASITGPDTFTVTAAKGFSGPGAVSFEVTTGKDAADPKGKISVLTVPVQVGRTKPMLICPSAAPLDVTQGASLRVPIATLCHVWTADPADARSVTIDASVTKGANALKARTDGQNLDLAASATAAPQTGATLRLRATVDKVASDPVDVPVSVVVAKAPTLAPVQVGDLKAGSAARTIDLAPYFHAGLPNATPRIVSVRSDSSLLRARVIGSSTRVQISARHGLSGHHRIALTMTDLPSGKPRPGRWAAGSISIDVLDVPGAPTAPQPGVVFRSHEIHLTWHAPKANGAPIDRYQLSSGAQHWTCATTACDATGLVNNRPYAFTVRAHNAVGWSKPSRLSQRAEADERPGQVGHISLTGVGDHRVTIGWVRPANHNDSSLKYYRVSWPGGHRDVTRPSATITGLGNDRRYQFTVVAVNRVGAGAPRTSGYTHSIGTPGKTGALRPTLYSQDGHKGVLLIDWGAVDPNGPGPVTYTIVYNGRIISSCHNVVTTQCKIAGVTLNGEARTLQERASNAGVPGVPGGARRTSVGAKAHWNAVGTPGTPDFKSITATGVNHQGKAIVSLPSSNGKEHEICFYNQYEKLSCYSHDAGDYTLLRTVGGTNGAVYDVYFRLCNESGCGPKSATHEIRPYGPLVSADIISCRHSDSGTTVKWTCEAKSGGRFALAKMAAIVGSKKKTWTNSLHVYVSRTWTFTTPLSVPVGSTVKLIIELVDDSGHPRGTPKKTYTFTNKNKGSG